MRRLTRTSFSESGPPADWERRFAAIVRDSRRVEPAAPASAGGTPADVAAFPEPPPPSRKATGSRPAAAGFAAPDLAGPDAGWAGLWAATPRSPAAPAPAEDGSAAISPDTLSFHGFDPFAPPAVGVATGERSTLSRLRGRLLKATRRKPRPPPAATGDARAANARAAEARAAEARAAEARAADRDAATVRRVGSAVAAAPDVPPDFPPDFPRRPSVRPGAAAWLSRTDGPLRSTDPVPVAWPAVASVLVIAASGLTAAYLTHRLGIDFEPELRSVAMPATPPPAAFIANAPTTVTAPRAPAAAPPAVPLTLGQALAQPDLAHRPAPPIVIAAAPLAMATPEPAMLDREPPVAPPLVANPVPEAAIAGSGLGRAEGVPPRAAPLAAVAAPSLASWGAPRPIVAAPLPGPGVPLPPARPVFGMAAPAESTTELVPSLPFPLEQLAAGSAGAEPVAALGTAGLSFDPLPALVPPLVPAAASVAEAITADTIDAVPSNGRTSDARRDHGSRRQLATPASLPEVGLEPASPLVADVQRALRRHGINPGPVDGIIGPRTVAAVRSFQSRIGESPDGVVDTVLLQHLKRTPPTQLADGVPGRPGAGDPLAPLVRALADLFGLPAGRGADLDGSIASAGGPQGDGND